MSITLIELDHFTGQRNTTPTPDNTARDLARVLRELQGMANDLQSIGAGHATSAQAVAATAEETVMIAPSAGVIRSVKAVAGTTAAAGESMTVDVKINGTTVLTGVVTLDDTAGTTVQSGTLDSLAIAFAENDLITVARTYTAGGGPTPMANTLVDVVYGVA